MSDRTVSDRFGSFCDGRDWPAALASMIFPHR